MSTTGTKKTIYCAGPLFNEAEKREMEMIANALEQAGFATFLPQRDGLELAELDKELVAMGWPREKVGKVISKAIFALDTFHVTESDGLVLNMNGRVPDEGAMVEAGVAWALGKTLVIYKNDARSMINGEDNPLVVGLANFLLVDSADAVVAQFQELFRNAASRAQSIPSLKEMTSKGKEISNCIAEKGGLEKLCELLVGLFEEDAAE